VKTRFYPNLHLTNPLQGVIFTQAFVKLNPTDALDVLQKNLPATLLEKYGLAKTQTKEITHIGQLVPLLIPLKTDELFAAGINKFSREFKKAGVTVYSYHFDRGNPFETPLKGIAHHALDLAYTSGNFENAWPDKKDEQLSNALIKYWIDFANGKEPWDSAASGKALHITTDAETKVVPREKVASRRWDGYVEMEKCWDKVRAVGNAMLLPKMGKL